MTVTLVLPPSIADVIRVTLQCPQETGAVIWARPVRTPRGDLRLLGLGIREIPHDAYLERTHDNLLVTSAGFVPPLAAAAAAGAVPLWMHTHPGDGASPLPSERDRVVDSQLEDLFRLRTGSDYYGSLILATRSGSLQFAGHLYDGTQYVRIDRLYVVGPDIGLSWNVEHPITPTDPIFDRQVRAFGDSVQAAVADLTISIVGCGGTGSAVAEQIVRLGAREIQLFDPDSVALSNLTRMYGAFPEDVGEPKAHVIASHLRRIAPDVRVHVWSDAITAVETARHLVNSDLVFGCTDDNAGRLVLSRLASYFLVPVIDLGVILSSDKDGNLEGIDGRVTVLHPGAGCLVCRDRIDLARATAESMRTDEHERLAAEGYAPALPGVEPAVGAFTTLVAAVAIAELLERLIHYGRRPTPNEILIRAHDREISTNLSHPRRGHYCDPSRGRLGAGFTEPFLEQTWSA